jgi:DNA-binding HxlR family transcriptional regulator
VSNDLSLLVSFFKALADESRLRIIGVLAGREATGGELAALLDLTPPTVTHHLAKLRALGLVERRIEGATHHYRLVPERLEALAREVLSSETARATDATLDHEAYAQKVLRSFVEGETILSIPSSRRKRDVVLAWLVERLPQDRELPELELNALIQRHHPDAAAIRRELVCSGFFTRTNSVYRRALTAPVDDEGSAAQRP